MRHRAPRRLIDLRYRVPLAAARLLNEAARPGPLRALVALTVILSLGTAAYAAVTSVTGGSSNQQAESAGATPSGDGEQSDGSRTGEWLEQSRDGERPDPATALPTTDDPSDGSSEPSTAAARATRGPSASAAREDNAPPRTSLPEAFPARDAARFSFSASEPASFTCSLDGAAFTPCDSPTSYSDLDPGWHIFAVRATDAAGNVDPSPVETHWHARDGRSADQ